VTVGFNVLDENGEDVKAPSCADARSSSSAVRQLPVDQDCNGIADDWENTTVAFPDPRLTPIRVHWEVPRGHVQGRRVRGV